MLIGVLAFLGGVLTIFSPCVLPVIPFVFARADQPFRKSGLPMLVGMAVSFSLFAAAAAIGGNWVVQSNQYGRISAMVVLGVMGLALLFPSLSERLTRPLVHLGNRLQQREAGRSVFFSSFVLGISIGLLWAPCAGPILGLVLAGAALGGLSLRTLFLLLAFAAGAATSLAIALLAGNRVLKILKKGFGAEEWIRRILGVAVLGGVVAIAFGLDTRFLAKLSFVNTNGVEQTLVNTLAGRPESAAKALDDEGPFPSLAGATQWLNSAPLKTESLKGKVVLVDFWTYSCINCLRSLPYIRAWADKYKDQGLVVIGVHAPEFAFERDIANVTKAVKDLEISYPVAIDNGNTIWRAFHNEYWPAHYFIDAKGRIRHHHFGEGSYEESERIIQELLAEARGAPVNEGFVRVHGEGALASSVMSNVASPETYLGTNRQENFASPETVEENTAFDYTTPQTLALNQWALQGRWLLSGESAELLKAPGAITYRFHARDLHLVLGSEKPVRFRILLDGKAPGVNHGTDTDAQGQGILNGQRLYQLIRQTGMVGTHIFTIEFLDPGAKAFAFTFG